MRKGSKTSIRTKKKKRMKIRPETIIIPGTGRMSSADKGLAGDFSTIRTNGKGNLMVELKRFKGSKA